MHKSFVIDCETKTGLNEIYDRRHPIEAPSNYKDPEKIKAYMESKNNEKAKRVDIDYADLFCLGIKEVGGEARCLTDKKEIETALNDITGFTIVTYNGLHFDIPLILRWGIKNNLNLPYGWLKQLTNRYEQAHIDIQDRMVEKGKFRSLDEFCEIYIGKTKQDINFDTATDEEIIKHNLEDLSMTEELFLTLKPILI